MLIKFHIYTTGNIDDYFFNRGQLQKNEFKKSTKYKKNTE